MTTKIRSITCDGTKKINYYLINIVTRSGKSEVFMYSLQRLITINIFLSAPINLIDWELIGWSQTKQTFHWGRLLTDELTLFKHVHISEQNKILKNA